MISAIPGRAVDGTVSTAAIKFSFPSPAGTGKKDSPGKPFPVRHQRRLADPACRADTDSNPGLGRGGACQEKTDAEKNR